MGKNKDRKRAEQGIIHRSGQMIENRKCAVPVCRHIADPRSQRGLCASCEYVIGVINYYIDQAEKAQKEHSGLLVPKPGMSKQAIAEAIRGKRA